VKEFQPTPAPLWSIFSPFKRRATPEDPPVDRFALPDIPAEWNPDSVSLQERIDIIEKAKKTAGFPKDDEFYYTTEEIATIKRHQAREVNRAEIARARSMLEQLAGQPYDQIEPADLRRFRDPLNIDPWTERVRLGAAAATATGPSGAGSAMMSGGRGDGAGMPGAPARDTPPNTPQKRRATTAPAVTAPQRQKTARRARVEAQAQA
jgi:hypothetical protein